MNISPKNLALLSIAALPMGILMLAKMFDSAVLGWMFGLTLAFGMALVPLAVILYSAFWAFGLALGKSRAARSSPAASVSAVPHKSTVHVERDSVHASDDAPSQLFTVAVACTLQELVADVLASGYLPNISGGRATWNIESIDGQGLDGRRIAVWAQEWSSPAFALDPGTSVASHFTDLKPGLYFRYLCQVNPEDVLAAPTLVRSQKV